MCLVFTTSTKAHRSRRTLALPAVFMEAGSLLLEAFMEAGVPTWKVREKTRDPLKWNMIAEGTADSFEAAKDRSDEDALDRSSGIGRGSRFTLGCANGRNLRYLAVGAQSPGRVLMPLSSHCLAPPRRSASTTSTARIRSPTPAAICSARHSWAGRTTRARCSRSPRPPAATPAPPPPWSASTAPTVRPRSPACSPTPAAICSARQHRGGANKQGTVFEIAKIAGGYASTPHPGQLQRCQR